MHTITYSHGDWYKVAELPLYKPFGHFNTMLQKVDKNTLVDLLSGKRHMIDDSWNITSVRVIVFQPLT